MTRTLPNKKTNTNAAHVEAIKPCLNIKPDLFLILTSFPLEHTLRDRCHGGVVSTLDDVKAFCETRVVVAHFGRPVDLTGVRIVPTIINTRAGGV